MLFILSIYICGNVLFILLVNSSGINSPLIISISNITNTVFSIVFSVKLKVSNIGDGILLLVISQVTLEYYSYIIPSLKLKINIKGKGS